MPSRTQPDAARSCAAERASLVPRWMIVAGLTLALMLAACGQGDPSADRRPPERAAGANHEPLAGGAGRATPIPSATAQASTPPPPRELLPDLQIMTPRELYIEEGAEIRKLRFSTTVINTGDGPLEIAGSYDAATRITTATQIIHRSDGTLLDEVAGSFMFHPGHEHWHFEDFTMLELWTHDDDGELVEMKATTGKATFCAVDEILQNDSLPNVPEGPSFLACGQGVQGISVGWSDTYTADLIGQELDITGVPDGRYAVRTVADPADRLRETDDDNNDLVVYVEIDGGSIELLDGP